MSDQLFYLRSYSSRLEAWTSLLSLYNPSFQKDFCHQNDLVLEVTTNSFNHSKVRIKQTFNFNKQGIQLFDEMRVCLPIRSDSTIDGRLKDNNIKIQYDHGINVWKGFVYDLYGSFNTSKTNSLTTNIQLGSILLSRIYTIDNLFKLSRNYVKWYHKTMLRFSDFRLGLVAVTDFHNSNIIKKDILLGYCKNKVQFFAHAIQGWNQLKYEPQYFSHYKLMFLYKQDFRRSIGIQAVIGKNFKSLDLVEGLIEHKYSEKNKMKIKVTNKFNVTLLLKNQWTDYLTTGFGCYLVMAPHNKVDKSKFGFKVELNI